MNEKYKQLSALWREISDLEHARALLEWDLQTYMPPGGAQARGRQMALLARLSHEKLTDPTVGRLLEELRPYAESLPVDSDEAALLRVARRDFERAVRVPAAFQARFYEHLAASYQAWTSARPDKNFALVLPFLQKTLDLSRELAGFFPGYQHIADPLIDLNDEGVTAGLLSALFDQLSAGLLPLVAAIAAQPVSDDSCLHQGYLAQEQLNFGIDVIRRFGFDFSRGRQDLTHHPFTTKFSSGDVRITTRVFDDYLSPALFGTLHEAGHALYEQGISERYDGTPLGAGTSSGVHESQSRLWENLIGRSRQFWEFFYPKLQATFPRQLGPVPMETFYRAINKVEPSLIRVEADEVTYNLHVIIRFRLELALLEGKLEVRDLPDAWRASYLANLGISPPDDRDGVLQDVHWYDGTIGGGFQGYTLGNVLNAQFFEAARAALPEIDSESRRGEFGALLGWLRGNIYQYGRKFTAEELVQRVCGGPLSVKPYLRYLRSKYGELYSGL